LSGHAERKKLLARIETQKEGDWNVYGYLAVCDVSKFTEPEIEDSAMLR
jgi:hypothetical protein